MKWFEWFGRKKKRTPEISVNNEHRWFDAQIQAIRRKKRQHPAMMTMQERHQETARIARKLDWSEGIRDPHGVLAAFDAIREHARLEGGAVDFSWIFTAEEREGLRQIVREEVTRVLAGNADQSGEAA
jgi:hypothetical protein